MQLPPLDTAPILKLWQEKVFALLLGEGKIDQALVDEMRAWPHSGFSVDGSVYLAAGDVAGLERLAQYMVRCPFSLARIVRVTDAGSVVYRAEKNTCRRFPPAASADLRGGPRRNFQVFDVFDFLAELTQHIPDKGQHLVRYYGWYSHRRRGMQAKQPTAGVTKIDRSLIPPNADSQSTANSRARTWAALIKRVYDVDPLICPRCGGRMQIISFIESRQREVIERILRHCGLWEGPLRTLPHPRAPPKRGSTAEQVLPAQQDAPRELQLVLDPEYL